jgi:hypothetical protein
MPEATRLIVCSVRADGDLLELPGSGVDPDVTQISGGERSLYELAVAGASLGIDVELRGGLNGPILAELVDAAGASPAVGLDPRPAARGDVVVVPEVVGTGLLAALLLSEATPVMELLAPPGLWGTSFVPEWRAPDPRSVDVATIGRPESFRAIAELGFTMWTNAHGTAEAAERAGCDATWLGTGTPIAFPQVPDKTFDIAIVANYRWAVDARAVAARVAGASVLEVPVVESAYSLAAHLAPARVLAWPSRIEGMSRIAREARSVGTVPVALDTNPFATADDHGGGVVLVPDLDAMADEVGALLRDGPRLLRLRSEAMASARDQADWDAYRKRVGAAFAHAAERRATRRHSYAEVGTLLRERLLADRAAQATHEYAMALRQNHIDALEGQIAHLQDERDHLLGRATAAENALAVYRSRLAVRIADAPSRLRGRARNERSSVREPSRDG